MYCIFKIDLNPLSENQRFIRNLQIYYEKPLLKVYIDCMVFLTLLITSDGILKQSV
jgi:hypothetical protein